MRRREAIPSSGGSKKLAKPSALQHPNKFYILSEQMCMVAFVIFEQELGSFNFRRVRADIRPASNQCGRILLDPHKECDLEI